MCGLGQQGQPSLWTWFPWMESCLQWGLAPRPQGAARGPEHFALRTVATFSRAALAGSPHRVSAPPPPAGHGADVSSSCPGSPSAPPLHSRTHTVPYALHTYAHTRTHHHMPHRPAPTARLHTPHAHACGRAHNVCPAPSPPSGCQPGPGGQQFLVQTVRGQDQPFCRCPSF